MNYTLLDIVQKVLSSMGSDSVNSINDTIESQDVASDVQTLFYDIVEEFELDGRKLLFQLDASGTSSRPTHMTLPASIREVFWVRYDNQNVKYVVPEEFIRRTSLRNPEDDYVDEITDTTGLTFRIINNIAPSVWTSFDDTTVVFDSYDSDEEATLQSSKTYCYGQAVPELVIDDASIPDLPDHLKHLLLREAIDYCTAIYKGKDTEKHRRARSVRSSVRRKTNQINNDYMDKRPDFGKR